MAVWDGHGNDGTRCGCVSHDPPFVVARAALAEARSIAPPGHAGAATALEAARAALDEEGS